MVAYKSRLTSAHTDVTPMAKRKTPQRAQKTSANSAAPEDISLSRQDSAARAVANCGPNAPDTNRLGWPPAWVRNTVSLLIILHGFALLAAVSSNLAPSYLQGGLLNRLAPYLNMTHQAYNALPLELTRGELIDFPLQVELQSQASGNETDVAAQAWKPMAIERLVDFAGAPAAQRTTRWPNIARWLLLTASADPENEILSDFSAQCIGLAEKQSGQRYSGVRLISPKVLSYDEDLALVSGMRESSDEEFQPSIVYSANIVRLGEGTGQERLSLVPAQPTARTAKPTSSTEVQP